MAGRHLLAAAAAVPCTSSAPPAPFRPGAADVHQEPPPRSLPARCPLASAACCAHPAPRLPCPLQLHLHRCPES